MTMRLCVRCCLRVWFVWLIFVKAASGILGVSFPKGGRQPTVVDILMGAPDVNSRVFSICVAEDGGVMNVGGYNTSLNTESPVYEGRSGVFQFLRSRNEKTLMNSKKPVWVPLSSESTYTIKIGKLWRNDTLIANGGFGDVLVDSGTTYSYFPSPVYNAIANDVVRACNINNSAPDHLSAGHCSKGGGELACYTLRQDLPTEEALARIPSMQVEFLNGGVIQWGPESFLFRKTGNLWCTAIEDNRRGQTILGMSFMKMKQVIFDRENSYIGFVNAECPKHSVQERSQFRTIESASGDSVGGLAVLVNGTDKIEWRKSINYVQHLPRGYSLDKDGISPAGWLVAGCASITVISALIAIVTRSSSRSILYSNLDENQAATD